MSEKENQADKIARVIVGHIDPYIQQQSQSAIDAIHRQRDEFETFVKQSGDDLARRFNSGVADLVGKATDKIQSAGESAVNDIQRASEQLRVAIDQAQTAASEAREAAKDAERLKSEAHRERQDAEEEKKQAQRATATLTMQTETIINRYAEKAALERRKRTIQAQLDSEEQSLEDAYDKQDAWLQRQVDMMVPDIKKKLDELAEENGGEEQ